MFACKTIYILFLAMFICGANVSVSYAQFSDDELAYTVSDLPTQSDGNIRKFFFTESLKAPLVYELKAQSYNVKDSYDYSGMAVYLGQAPAVKVMENGHAKLVKLKKDQVVISDGEWTGFKGRFKAVLVQTKTGVVRVSQETITVNWPEGVVPDLVIVNGMPDSPNQPSVDDLIDIRTLQYAHLPRWMRVLCVLVEGLYKNIQSVVGLSWGSSLIIFAIIIKLLLLPTAMLTTRFQNQANTHKAALEPVFEDITKNFKGEVAHKKVMAAYKSRGITPYYSLKPLLVTMISLPVLIAIFNMLAEVEPLRGAQFLWIESLALPDSIFQLPARLPVFGQYGNLLPFLMAGVTFFSAITLKNDTASAREISRQKRNLILMGVAFFVIFYPFPSAMVLYWTLSTLLQVIANKVIKRA